MEVLTEYYSQDHARGEWADAKGERANEEPRVIHVPDSRAVGRVLKKISEKVEKRFEYPHKLILVVDIAPAVLTTVDDFKRITERLFFPSPPQYHAIFLLDREDRLEALYET